MKEAVRLDKFLADAGLGTRKEVKKLISQGRITNEAGILKDPAFKVQEGMRILLDGTEVQAGASFVYYLLHKPAGYVSATEDAKDPTVLELVPSSPRRQLFPVGRLDKDTEGLLLITDDGQLSHRLLAPGRHVDKVYFARIRGEMGEDDIARFEEGIDIGDEKPTLPARLELLQVRDGSSEVKITLHEGRYHQIKRMAAALGKEVTYLKRLSMGELILPEDMPAGTYMELDASCRPVRPAEYRRKAE